MGACIGILGYCWRHRESYNNDVDGLIQFDGLGKKVDYPSSSTCNKILVNGFSENTPDDLIRLFFGNKRRTGGGPVSCVNRISKTCVAIEFESAEDAKSVLQKGSLILDQHVLEINHLDSVTVKLQSILPHTFGNLGDSGDAVSCDPKPEQRSDCSSVSLQITEQDVPIPVPLPESKLLPIVDKPSNLHDIDTNSINKEDYYLDSCSFLIFNALYVKYLLGINGQEYLKTIGRSNHCSITVGDVSSKDSGVFRYRRGFLPLADIKLDCMCNVVIAMGDIDVCDTDAVVYIYIVELSEATRIKDNILNTGEIAHSIGQLDVFKNFEILVTQPGLLSSKTIFHVVLSCEQNVIEDSMALFEKLIENVLKEADKMNIKSVAIPGPNGAVLDMPMPKTCGIILTVTNAFLTKQSDQSCLKKIVVIHSSHHVVRNLLLLSKNIFGCRSLLSELASSILADDMLVDNLSQYIESTEHGLDHVKDVQQFQMVVINGLSAESIKNVKDDILHHLAHYFYTEELPCIGLANFTEKQKQDIFSLEKTFDVTVNMNKIKGVVEFSGEELNVVRAVSKTKDIILSYIGKQRHPHYSSSYVRWQYNGSDGNFTNFSWEHNGIIEKAFKDGCPEVCVQTRNKIKFRIVFEELKEYCVTGNTRGRPKSIRRLDRPEESCSIRLPSSWEAMGGEVVTRVAISRGSFEYKKVENKIGNVISILKIERIQNRTLFQQYKVKQFEVEKFSAKKTDNEKILFHGTSSDCVEPIIQNGFNRSLCGKNGTVYGDGVYFAVDPQYSMTYGQNQQVFQVRVLVGETTTGHHGLKTTPLKPGTNRHYDSVTDSELSPKMFVIFHDAQAYPDYLITFGK